MLVSVSCLVFSGVRWFVGSRGAACDGLVSYPEEFFVQIVEWHVGIDGAGDGRGEAFLRYLLYERGGNLCGNDVAE